MQTLVAKPADSNSSRAPSSECDNISHEHDEAASETAEELETCILHVGY